MNTIKDRLFQDMNEALKARETGRQRLSAIRMLRAAVQNAEKGAVAAVLDDAAVLGVLAREAKRLEDSIREYQQLGRPERVRQLESELAVVREYLPQSLGADEVAAAAASVIEAIGATGPADMGRVMKELMPRLAGRADGRLASEAVKRLLAPR